MRRLTLFVAAVCLISGSFFPSLSWSAEKLEPPSVWARKIPGALGKKEMGPFDGESGDTWWEDDDGVDPAKEGCHYEYDGEAKTAKLTGRFFGELCESRTVLVETNPEKGKRHKHPGSKGHPDLFDCDVYCRSPQIGCHLHGTCQGVASACPQLPPGKRAPDDVVRGFVARAAKPSAKCACTRELRPARECTPAPSPTPGAGTTSEGPSDRPHARPADAGSGRDATPAHSTPKGDN